MCFPQPADAPQLWKTVLQIGPSIWFASTDVKSDKLFSTAGGPLL